MPETEVIKKTLESIIVCKKSEGKTACEVNYRNDGMCINLKGAKAKMKLMNFV